MMRYKQHTLVISAMAAMLLLFAAGSVKSADLELILHTDKTTYLIGEPIWIDILVLNHDSDTIDLPWPNPAMDVVKISVIRNGTDTLKFLGDKYHMGKLPTYSLTDNDTLYCFFNLLRGCKDVRISPFQREPLDGRIDISAEYVFAGRMNSNTISFDIVPPTGDEEQAYDLWQKGDGSIKPEAGIPPLERLLELYPNSVYAAVACRRLAGTYGVSLHDSTKYLEYTLMILEKYPSSGWVNSAIAKYLGDSKETEREEKLDSLMQPDKPFRLRMIAGNVRRGITWY